MVFGNVELEVAVHDKQVSYYITQRLSVAGVFSSFGDSVTKDLSNGFGNVVTCMFGGRYGGDIFLV